MFERRQEEKEIFSWINEFSLSEFVQFFFIHIENWSFLLSYNLQPKNNQNT